MTLCSKATLVGEHHGGGGVAVTLHCMKRDCPHCAPIYKARLAKRILSGDPTHFLTLKCNPDWFASPDERAENMSRAWSQTRRRAARLGIALPFLSVFEKGETGEPHLHIVVRLPDGIGSKWLRSWLRLVWRELVGSTDINVQSVYSLPKLAEYMAKAPHLFVGRRRFWRSRTWATVKRAVHHLAFKIMQILWNSLDTLEARFRSEGIAYQRICRERLLFMPP